jgi:hypothetical protein
LGGSQFEACQEKQFLRPHLHNNQNEIDWRRGSSGRAPALLVQSPKFKPQTYKKKKKVSENAIDVQMRCEHCHQKGVEGSLQAHKLQSMKHQRSPQQAGHRWLTPVILATQEAESRIAVRSQPGQIF